MRKFPLDIFRSLVVLIAMLSLGSNLAVAQVTVSLPEVTHLAGTSFNIPITTGDLSGQDVKSYQFTVTYDASVINITGASITGTLSDGGSLTVNTGTAGQVQVAYAKATALSGAGTLINLNATAVGTGSNSAIAFSAFQFNEGTPADVTDDGTVSIPPLGVSMPANASASVGTTTTIPVTTVGSTTTDVLSYQFTVTYDPTVLNITGASIAGTTSEGGSLTVNPGSGTISVAYAKTTAITVPGVLLNFEATVLDAKTSALTFASFQFNEGTPTSAQVNGSFTGIANGAPVFTSQSGDVTIDEGTTHSATFAATDPEGATVSLSLSSGASTPNASFDPATGAFSFSPDLTQGGAAYSFTVTASDGAVSTDASFTVTVNNVTETFTANLAAINEVPAIEDGPTPISAASGFATAVLDPGTNVLTVSGLVQNLVGTIAGGPGAHIHIAPVGQNGGVALPLTLTVGSDGRSAFIEGANNTFPLSAIPGFDAAGFLTALRSSGTYVNVHSSAYIPGEVRGQLTPGVNTPPGTSAFTNPADGSSFTITGNPVSVLFTLAWAPATDPEGSPVNYVLQLAADPTFASTFTSFKFPLPAPVPVQVETAADIYDQVTMRDPGNIALGGTVTVYGRILTTDGSLWSSGPSAAINLTRGTITSTEENGVLPTEFALKGNYPNPFNPTTSIQFDLPEAASVTVSVVDMLGRQVMEVPAQQMLAGANRVVAIDAASLASGIYVYRVTARTADQTLVKAGTMTLLK